MYESFLLGIWMKIMVIIQQRVWERVKLKPVVRTLAEVNRSRKDKGRWKRGGLMGDSPLVCVLVKCEQAHAMLKIPLPVGMLSPQ